MMIDDILIWICPFFVFVTLPHVVVVVTDGAEEQIKSRIAT